MKQKPCYHKERQTEGVERTCTLNSPVVSGLGNEGGEKEHFILKIKLSPTPKLFTGTLGSADTLHPID